MDSYLLALYVTLEQEIAIRELFTGNGWLLKKYEDYGGHDFNEIKVEMSATGECQKLGQVALQRTESLLTISKGPWSASNTSTIDSIYCHGDSFVNGNSRKCSNNEHLPLSMEQELINKNTEVSNNISSGTDTEPTEEKEIFSHLSKIMEDSLKSESENNTRYDVTKCENDFINSLFTENDLSKHESEKQDSDHDVQEGTFDTSDEETSNQEQGKEHIPKGGKKKKRIIDKYKMNKCPANKSLSADVYKGKKRKMSPRKLNIKNAEKTEESEDEYTEEEIQKNTKRKRVPSTVGALSKRKTGSFHCNECNYTFRLLGPFNNHKREGKCKFECKYCGKMFTSRYYSNYLSHLKYHIKDRPHECNICKKTYIEAQALKIHMRKHSGDRPFVCDLCGKRFYASSHLVCHKNQTHKESDEVHQCDMCGAVLSTVGNLRVHKKVVHTIDRPFTCEICGKTFKTKKSLEQVHAKVHNEIYPFVCEFSGCDKAFKRGEGLSDHMKRHNNQRSHFCERCGKGFYSNKDLLLHTRTHTGEKPFSCQMCGYKCALAGNLRKHMKTHQ